MARQYSCNACAFRVRSEHEDEVIELVRTHADEYHDMTMSTEDVRSRLRDA